MKTCMFCLIIWWYITRILNTVVIIKGAQLQDPINITITSDKNLSRCIVLLACIKSGMSHYIKVDNGAPFIE